MRVLHVVSSAQRRGAEIFASDLVAALDGIEQRVALIRHVPGPSVDFAAPVELLGANGGRGPVSLPALRALRTIVRTWRPDIVQAHGGEALKYATAARGMRAPRVVYRRIGSAHGYADRRLARVAYARLIRSATVTVAVADEVRRHTIDIFGVPPARVVTIPNAVDSERLQAATDRQQVRAAMNVPSDARVILSLGAFTWEKDPLGLLDVVERVLVDRDDVVCLMAGDGPLRADVEAAIAARRLDEQIKLLGSRTDVAELLGAADVLVLASVTEGMPAALIEAGMAGLPVAAYDIGGVGEVVGDDAGVLARPGDVEQLATRLGALLDDEPLRRRMGRAAQDRCRATFDVVPVAARYRALYEEVLAS